MYVYIHVCNILFLFLEPSITAVEVQLGRDGITLSWGYLHTGGLNITLVEILLREKDREDSAFVLVPGGTIREPSNESFLISGRYLEAGVSYLLGVRAGNEFGVSDLTVSKPQTATVGM